VAEHPPPIKHLTILLSIGLLSGVAATSYAAGDTATFLNITNKCVCYEPSAGSTVSCRVAPNAGTPLYVYDVHTAPYGVVGTALPGQNAQITLNPSIRFGISNKGDGNLISIVLQTVKPGDQIPVVLTKTPGKPDVVNAFPVNPDTCQLP
jgi:hypothetical protein